MANGSLLFPVGHSNGPLYHADSPNPEALILRVGLKSAMLSLDEFRVWAVAHGSTADAGDGPWTRKKVEEAAAGAEVADPAAAIDHLLGLGVLREVDPASPEAVEFARQVRIFPLLLGLGNSAEEPLQFQIGVPGQPAITVSPNVYQLWRRGPVYTNLWNACRTLAKENAQLGLTEKDDIGEAEVLAGFLRTLHGLLSVSALYIDAVPSEDSARQADKLIRGAVKRG